MHFGKGVTDFSTFDHHLPPDTALTIATLAGSPAPAVFEAYVGAPKWAYKHWLGGLYPIRTQDADFLKHYAKHFNAVEFGATFYQPQPLERITAWKALVKPAPDFKFCPKFPQSITYFRRFRNVDQQTDAFYTSITAFGEHLGPVFLQLPESFAPNAFSDLEAYLKGLPKDVPLFVEVRNQAWFSAPVHREKLFHTLKALGIGAVLSDTPGRRDCLHMELPTPHAFIRFVNSGNPEIDFLRLDEWVRRLKRWKDEGLQSLYFFIHAGDAPSLAFFDYLVPKLNPALGVNVKVPGRTGGPEIPAVAV